MTPTQFQIQKAIREQVLLRVALIGPSGAGKTYSALTLAAGIGGPVCLLDTESGRGKIYADEFDYGYVELAEPRSPERYIEAIGAIAAQGIRTLIIDGMFHEWQYILNALDSLPDKNEFTRWGKLTPRHDKFLSTIQEAPMHIIACLRGKDKYELVEEGGKKKPKKLGVGPQFREGFEYDCHVAFILDVDGNTAIPVKDNTHFFEILNRRLTREDGQKLAKWVSGGVSPAARPAASAPPPAAPAANLERPTEIELKAWAKKLAAASDLFLLAGIWEDMAPRLKLCGQDTIQNFVGIKNARKIQLEEAAAQPPPAADAGTGIFDASGKVRDVIPPAAGASDGLTLDQRSSEGHYASFIRKAKQKAVLEGLAEAVEDERKGGKLTDDQARKLLGMIDERAAELKAAKRKPAAVAA